MLLRGEATGIAVNICEERREFAPCRGQVIHLCLGCVFPLDWGVLGPDYVCSAVENGVVRKCY